MEMLIAKLKNSLMWNGLIKAQKAIMVTMAVFTIIIMFAETLLRQIDYNFGGYEEFLLIAVFWMYMMGGSLGSYEKSHITADILQEYMREGTLKNTIVLLTKVATFILAAILMIWMYRFLLWGIDMNPKTSMWKVPQVIGFSSLFFGMVLIVFYNLIYLIEDIIKFTKSLKNRSSNTNR